MILDDEGALEKISRFLPTESFLSPQDLKFGPDGALYTLEWGGGFGRDNPNSGIYRIEYISGSRSPVAVATATPDNGQEPLTVAFSGLGSSDPEGGTLTYAWDFDGDGTTDSTEPTPTHVYAQPGVYQARLTVADPAGKDGTTVIPVTVGNTKPVVEITGPVDGGFVDWGDTIPWSVSVTDPEDGTINANDVIMQPALGHDSHTHPTVEQRGTSGTVTTDLGGGHSEDMKVFFALDARYTDKGDGTVPPLTGSDTVVLQPKHKEAEHAERTLGTSTADATGDPEGGASALTELAEGDWAAYEPVNFTGTDTITFRVASSQAGGAIELRSGAPDGALLGTAEVPATGGSQSWADVTIPTPESTETMSLYLVFKGTANFRLNFWEIGGKGLSPDTPAERADHLPDADAGARARPEHAGGRGDRRRERDHQRRVLHRRREGRRGRDGALQRRVDADRGGLLRRPRRGDQQPGPELRLAARPLHGRRVRRPPAVADVLEHPRQPAGSGVRPARRQLHGHRRRRRPLAGHEPVRRGLPRGRRAGELRGHRQGRVVRRHALELEGRDHRSQRHLRRRRTGAATSSCPRRATARPSTCTTPAATARSTTPASRSRPPARATTSRPG